MRTRFAEDALAAAAARGVSQLVVLGAGLDTYAYRNCLQDRLRVFEVDHPETQAWKREQLAKASIAVPEALTFAPIDFEHDTLADGLAAAGFDPQQQTFFTWLGVTPYLTESAIFATLGFIAALPGGAHVVFDYSNPPDSIVGAERRAFHEALATRVAAAGETFKSYFGTEALVVRLADLGFRDIEDLGPAEIAARYFPDRVGESPRRRRAYPSRGDALNYDEFWRSRFRHRERSDPKIATLACERRALRIGTVPSNPHWRRKQSG